MVFVSAWSGVMWEVQVKAVGKFAALQVAAGSVFLPFLSFPLCPLQLSTLSWFSLCAVAAVLHEGAETF